MKNRKCLFFGLILLSLALHNLLDLPSYAVQRSADTEPKFTFVTQADQVAELDSNNVLARKSSCVGDVPSEVVSMEGDYTDHINAVLEGCGDICSIQCTDAVPSLYFDYIEKQVDCMSLLTNPAIDAAMKEERPPASIPEEMLDFFSYSGKVQMKFWGYILNQRYMGGNARNSDWSKELIDDMADQCSLSELRGGYGVAMTRTVVEGLDQIHTKNSSVLVMGSETPWVESCLLSLGARDVTTIEYGAINSTHPQVKTFTPDQVRADPKQFLEKYDAVVIISSVEHSGLGRYGDAMNPWGDRQAIARAWCMTKKQGNLVLNVPYNENDAIYYNAHRV